MTTIQRETETAGGSCLFLGKQRTGGDGPAERDALMESGIPALGGHVQKNDTQAGVPFTFFRVQGVS